MLAIAHAFPVAAAHEGTVSVGAIIAVCVGTATIAGFALSLLTYWITQRRVRPIVICHEHRKRHIENELNKGYWAASVYLTNESITPALNVRFGIDMSGRHASWKHARTDETASRLIVLRANCRFPETGEIDVVIDDRMIWHISSSLAEDADPDDGRVYWAYYQAPAGDWWYTSNPSDRTTDLTIRRVRSRRFGPISRGNRQLVRSIEEGAEIRAQSIQELNDAIARQRELKVRETPSERDEPGPGRLPD